MEQSWSKAPWLSPPDIYPMSSAELQLSWAKLSPYLVCSQCTGVSRTIELNVASLGSLLLSKVFFTQFCASCPSWGPFLPDSPGLCVVSFLASGADRPSQYLPRHRHIFPGPMHGITSRPQVAGLEEKGLYSLQATLKAMNSSIHCWSCKLGFFFFFNVALFCYILELNEVPN